MVVERLDDVMRYYHYAFIPFYLFTLSSIILMILSFKSKKNGKSALIVMGFNMISLLFQAIFQGVLADNNAPNHEAWWIQTFILLGLNFILILVQLVIMTNQNKK